MVLTYSFQGVLEEFKFFRRLKGGKWINIQFNSGAMHGNTLWLNRSMSEFETRHAVVLKEENY